MMVKERVLLEIFRSGEITRMELSRRLGVAKSTLSYVLKELRENGKVEIKLQRIGRGRPREIVSISPKAWKSLGIKIGREAVVGILLDASLREVSKAVREVTHEFRSNTGFKKLLEDVLEEMMSEDVEAIGISVSGEVHGTVITEAPILNVYNLDLSEIVGRFFAGTFEVVEDVRAVAVYERFEYGGDSFLIVNYGLGIGGCWCEGDRSMVLPLGHTVVDPDGEECYCGQRGCLETVASDYAVLKSFTSGSFTIREFVEYEHERYGKSLEELWKISKGDPGEVRRHYERAIENLSLVVGNTVKLLRPRRVALYGEGMFDWIAEEIERRVKERFRGIEVEVVHRGDLDAFEKGAAILAVIEGIRRGVIG